MTLATPPVAALVVLAEATGAGADVLRVIAGVLAAAAVAGAATCFLRHRLLPDGPSQPLGLGLGLLALDTFVGALRPSGGVQPISLLAVSLLLLLAAAAPPIDLRPSPARLAAPGAVVVGALLGLALGDPGPAVAVEAAAAAAAGAAVALAMARPDGLQGGRWWAASLAVALVLAVALQLGSRAGADDLLLAIPVVLLGGVLTGMVRTVRDLVSTSSSQEGLLLGALVEQEAANARIQAVHTLQRVRTHDARNALTGIGGATATLERYADRLDEGSTARLRHGVTQEVARLQRLLGPVTGDTESFGLAGVLRPLLAVEHPDGVTVEVAEELRALGHAEDVATVVGCLIASARNADDRSRVHVSARRLDDRVVLTVAGPSPGRIALLACEQVMRAQGAHVRLDADGRTTVELPVAR